MVSLRPRDTEQLYRVNVDATRILLEECLRAEVERVVYTSSVAAIGPAPPGKTADETQVFTAGELGIPYINSKHEGEVEALRIAAHGLPLVCVNPCVVFGAGDVYGTSTSLVRRFLLGRIPAYLDGGLNIVDVGDVAAGHLLADERGSLGERYILGNRNYTTARLFADLGRVSGMEPPVLKLPAELALRLAELAERGPGRPIITVNEVKSVSQWWTYRNTKAKRELGWKTSPHEETLEATVNWVLEREGDRVARARRSQPYHYRAAATALGMLEGGGRVARRLLRRG
jgi:dihydroflavonol-4-reductase